MAIKDYTIDAPFLVSTPTRVNEYTSFYIFYNIYIIFFVYLNNEINYVMQLYIFYLEICYGCVLDLLI